MSVAGVVISRPVYTINNIISTAISSKEDDEKILRNIIELLVPVTILLDNYITQIYNSNQGR